MPHRVNGSAGYARRVTAVFELAEALVRRACRLPAFEMRVAIMREHVEDAPPEITIEVIAIICREGEARAREWHEALPALIAALADAPEGTRDTLATLARERGHDAALRLVRLRPEPARARDGEDRVPDYGAGRPLTLGERKSIARKPRRDLIERAINDPDPAVIRMLLRNPRVTENDVVRLCARRPCPPAVLRAASEARRWIDRPRVRIALVRNPDTPADVSLRLVPLLLRQELREVAQSVELPASVRVACAELLRTRPPSADDPDPTVH
jgi:hypothetical protein